MRRASFIFFVGLGNGERLQESARSLGRIETKARSSYFSFFVFFRPPPLKEPLWRREVGYPFISLTFIDILIRQLFREKMPEKVHETTPRGIVGSFK